MAVSNYTGLVIPHPQTGVQITKVTDTSAEMPASPTGTGTDVRFALTLY
jgi:hypothetical protein